MVAPLAALVEQVFHRHLGVFQDHRGGAAALDAQLVLLCSGADTRHVALHDKGAEVGVVDLGEHDEGLSPTTVGDEHLLAVDDVVLAVLAEHRLGAAAAHRVGTGARLSEAVGRDFFAHGQVGQVLFFLLLVAVVDDRQGADTGVGALGHGKGTGLADFLGHAGGGYLVQSQASELLGNVGAQQAQLAGLSHELFHQLVVFFLDLIAHRVDLAGNEISRGGKDHLVLVGKLLGHESRFEVGGAKQKTAALGNLFVSHDWAPSI